MYLRVGTSLYGFYLYFLSLYLLTNYLYFGYDISVVRIVIIRMDMSKTERLNYTKTSKDERPLTSNLTLEERLKVITNLIVDRILEDQINGKLRFKNKST